MSSQVSTFPDKIEVRFTAQPAYNWPVIVDLGNGNHLFLSDELADDLAQQLWNRNLKQAEAA